jgi:hypothetical protein
LEIDYCPKISAHPAGMIFNQEGRFFLAARDGVLEIKSIQLAGKNKMPVKDFINGHPNLSERNLFNYFFSVTQKPRRNLPPKSRRVWAVSSRD